jgi:hypothetical protein
MPMGPGGEGLEGSGRVDWVGSGVGDLGGEWVKQGGPALGGARAYFARGVGWSTRARRAWGDGVRCDGATGPPLQETRQDDATEKRIAKPGYFVNSGRSAYGP